MLPVLNHITWSRSLNRPTGPCVCSVTVTRPNSENLRLENATEDHHQNHIASADIVLLVTNGYHVPTYYSIASLLFCIICEQHEDDIMFLGSGLGPFKAH
jgi:hypothetical protein